MRLARFLTAAPPFVAGAMLLLYGIFALTFNEGNGSTYVRLAGHQFDAHRVGAACVVLGLIVIGAAVSALRHRGSRS
jgi:hypothetical protein